MDLATLEARLLAAVQPHDLLCHPFYRAWSAGELSRGDLRGYAAQYQHQVDALPALLVRALEQSSDPATRGALERNLADETGEVGPPHAELWRAFTEALGAPSDDAADAETLESSAALRHLIEAGELAALATLWAYELQTARVARTKREGLVERYGFTSERGLAFFALHESLDVHHAADLLSAVARLCGESPQRLELACQAATESAKAQWRFLDGAERHRLAS